MKEELTGEVIVKCDGYDVIIDKEDERFVTSHNWSANKRDIAAYGLYYFICRVGAEVVSLHRYLLGCKWRDGNVVDHINGNTLDNRKTNLRLCNKSQSQMNRGRQSNNKTGYKGVSYRKDKGKYEGRIKVNGKTIHLGYTYTAEESYERYIAAAREHYGCFFREETALEKYADELEGKE